MKKIFFPLFICLLSFLNLSAQTTDRHGCFFTEVSPAITGPFKPLVTPNSFLRILVVYVQFANESIEPSHPDWPAGDPPDYFGELLAEEEDHRTDWWNAYSTSTESISSWFCEVSRGQLHIIGKEYNIVLDYDSSHYQNANGESEVNKEVYDKLTELIPEGNWSPYDNWTLNPTTQTFTNEPDGKIDMIYKIHRHRYSGIFSEHPASGYALLGKADGQWEYEVDPINQKSVLGGFPEYTTGQTDGSGLGQTFIDFSEELLPGPPGTYPSNLFYRVTARDNQQNLSIPSNTVSYSIMYEIGGGEQRPGNEEISEVPDDFTISNYPNPFNPSTMFNYEVPAAGNVQLKVYNITGQLAAELINGYKEAGKYSIQFNASHLSGGVYFYNFVTPSGIITKKLLLLK